MKNSEDSEATNLDPYINTSYSPPFPLNNFGINLILNFTDYLVEII